MCGQDLPVQIAWHGRQLQNLNLVALAASLPGTFDQVKSPAFPSRLKEAGKAARFSAATAGVEA